MRITDYLTSLFGSTDDEAPTVDALEELFRKRQATLDLTAEFHLPAPNMTDEPTAVFPYTLLTNDGERYGTGSKEFPIPDDGFEDNDAPITQFISNLSGTDAGEVDIDALRSIDGTTADATLNDEGDVIVEVSA